MNNIRLLDRALDIHVGSVRTKMVLVVMARRGNKSGICFMSQKSIAYEANCSVKSVERAIKELVGRGLIFERKNARRSRRTKTYRLCISGEDNSHSDGSEPTQ